jgi:Protein of unknown function (DUF1553)/Protein of unknown function (DUF1549)/Planctomycete cytochrome C
MLRFYCNFLLVFVAVSSLRAADPPKLDYGRDIQPILSDNCFQCHGPDAKARKANLRLDTFDGATGKGGGPVAIKPGDSKNSELIKRIHATDPAVLMPHPKSKRTLSDAQKKLLAQWIDEGAGYSGHWAFAKILRPAIRTGTSPVARRNAIDDFIVARLAKDGLVPSPEADKAKLLRRVSLDLIGLPPSPEEIDAFLADKSQDAYEKAVDRLMGSQRYGERMVWEWLDAARYADTNGYQGDPTRSMWYWRDWVIKALNDNMRFDQFTIEQIAGDLLPNPTREQLIATGFHRNHMLNGEGGRIAEESRVEYVQDRVETTGAVWLGLTLYCCRCHDHKYDPIKTREYYQLAAYFNSIEESGAVEDGRFANPTYVFPTPEQAAAIAKARAAHDAAKQDRDALEKKLLDAQPKWEATLGRSFESLLPASIKSVLAKPANQRSDAEKKELAKFYLDGHKNLKDADAKSVAARKTLDGAERSAQRTMVMRERKTPRDTFIMIRGAYDKPGEKVSHGTPAILPPLPPDAPKNRLALAKWLISPGNPLTPRVVVNRLWQQFFGVGIVKTSEDFGLQGERPVNQDLLDWLASEFVASGWNMKHMVRLIVTSHAYRQSSRVSPELLERDPDNRLLARGPRHRLPSWMIRDQALFVSGLLVEKLGGPPVKGYQPLGIWEDATFGQINYTQDHGEALYRRSLYQFWRRIVGPTMFFDVGNRQTCIVRQERTNTPLQALALLNDTTYVEAARALAQRILLTKGLNDETRLALAFRRCTGRNPDQDELTRLQSRLAALRAKFKGQPDEAKKLLAIGESKPDASVAIDELAAWTSLCNLMLNLDETISKE